MKKLSEVCKLVGVTRRTLQEYDRIDLLKPSDKTDAGYWLYNDEAIQKLIFIQIFVEAEYKRKEIKDILKLPVLDIAEIYENVIDKLTEKRKRIDGMINTVKTLQLITELPENTLRALSYVDIGELYKKKSFSQCLEESVANAANYNESENDEAKLYIPFWYQLSAIGCMKNKEPGSKEVQECVKNFCDYFVQMVFSGDENDSSELEEYAEAELAEELQEATEEMIKDAEIEEMIMMQCGNGAKEFIISALRIYTKKRQEEEKRNVKL